MEKIWLKHYPPGVPAQINPDAYASIIDIFNQSVEQYAQFPAFYNLGSFLSYAQLDSYSRSFAAYLQNELNLKKGTRVAIMLPNLLQYPIALFGALRAGMIVVNVNPLYTSDELRHQMNDSGAEVIVSATNFAATIEKALPQIPHLKYVILTQIGDLFPRIKGAIINFVLKYIQRKIPTFSLPKAIRFKDVLKIGENLPFHPVTLTGDDIAFLQYTGGTTGVAKGAILTHRNLVANIQQAEAWFKSQLNIGKEIIITALPLYHIFSLTANCLFFIKNGGLNVLITNPRDIPGMIKEMRKFKFTAITGVNTLFNALLKDPHFASLDFSALHLTLGGGMAVQKPVALKWQAVSKSPLLEAYGLTETSPCVTINPVTLSGYNGTIGLPVSSTEVAILDDEQKELGINEPGELAIKGPQVMKGYWQNPAETQKVFTKNGYFLSGDIAKIDENGYVTLLERKKDMIIVSGFNVYPNELEDVIAALPGVREVAVIGVEDPNSGEVPKAFIVKDDPNLTVAQVIKHCREHLTPYKVPKHVEFISELPKTNVGKILRRSLKIH